MITWNQHLKGSKTAVKSKSSQIILESRTHKTLNWEKAVCRDLQELEILDVIRNNQTSSYIWLIFMYLYMYI